MWCLQVWCHNTCNTIIPELANTFCTNCVFCMCVYVISVSIGLFFSSCYLWYINLIWVPQEMKSRTFNARKMFHYAVLCVRAMVRIKRLRFTPEPLSMDVAQVDPYRIKVLRKVSYLFMFYMRLIMLVVWYMYRPAGTCRFRTLTVVYIILI